MFEEIKNKNIVVTGGLGFVGHNLVKSLVIEHGCKVTVIDNCMNSSLDSLSEIEGKYLLVKKSVLDQDTMNFYDSADFIFHLACVQIAHSSSDPLSDLAVNAESTLRILEYLRNNRERLPLKRFIYTSSASVYGNAKNFPSREDGSSKPQSLYAATKQLGESYTLIYNKNFGIPVCALRYSNIYGYGQSPDNTYCGVLGKFIHNALVGIPLTIIGDGQQTRDYTFITDAVDATILAAIHLFPEGQVFNIGTGVETSVNQLVNLIQEIMGEITIEYHPPRDIDNIRRRVMDISAIQDKMGWVPRVVLKKGLELTIQNYRDYLAKRIYL